MRHRVDKKKLNMPHDQRVALLKNLAREVFEHGNVITTKTKAKVVKPFVESIITKGKKAYNYSKEIEEKREDSSVQEIVAKNVSIRRQINRNFGDRKLVKKICDDIAPKYIDRNGGYTRILNIGTRRGDAAELVILQLVDESVSKNKE
ncbi:MAG: large subunit ribosomal protein [Kosmotogales bacterium]|nr:large subunit ribosomal protein [Kosmotogales bacterium]